jgi:hypothetical protein
MGKESYEDYLRKIIKRLRDPKNIWTYGKELYATKLGDELNVLLYYYTNKDIMVHITKNIDSVEIDEFRKVIPYSEDSEIIKDLLSLKDSIVSEKDLVNLKKLTKASE